MILTRDQNYLLCEDYLEEMLMLRCLLNMSAAVFSSTLKLPALALSSGLAFRSKKLTSQKNEPVSRSGIW